MIARLHGQDAAALPPAPARVDAARWLAAILPGLAMPPATARPAGGQQLCHGDLALGQILDGPHGLCLVDLDRCHRGDAAADLARFLVSLQDETLLQDWRAATAAICQGYLDCADLPVGLGAALAMAARFDQADVPLVIAPPGDGKLGSVAAMADWLVAVGLGQDQLGIGCIGRICRQKGQDIFVQTALALRDRMPKAQFLIIGSAEDAAMATALQAQIAAAGAADRIRFLGHRQDMAPIYRALDILASPSRWEGFGLMLAEAMAAGCPVVASHVGAIPEVAAGAALLVPPDDPDALATALAGLDAPIRRDLREKGLIRSRAFVWQEASAQMAAIYDRILV